MSSKFYGIYNKKFNKLGKNQLLILYDFGLQVFNNLVRESLMDFIDDLFNQTSTIVSSQIPLSAWFVFIGEETIADTILNR